MIHNIRALTSIVTFILVLQPAHLAFSQDTKTPSADAWIGNAVRFIMEADGRLIPSEIEITVDRGTVTLNGTVVTDYEKGLAERLAASIPSVTGVNNQLKVLEAVDEDVALRKTVRLAIIQEQHVKVFVLKIHAKNGSVRLRGIVQTPKQKAFVESLVKSIKGVKEITNEITVMPNIGLPPIAK